MSKIFNDEFHGVGGSFEIRDGKRVRVHETVDHPEGNRARDADGKALDQPLENAPALVAPTQEAAAGESSAKRRRAASAE
jgi:hypothetical protein